MPAALTSLRSRLGAIGNAELVSLAVTVVAGVLTLGGTAAAAHGQPERDFGLPGVALLATAVLALFFRHRHAVPVLAVVVAVIATYWSLDFARGPVFFPLLVAFVTVVLQGHRLAAIVSLLVGFVVFPWGGYLLGTTDERPTWSVLLGLAAWLVTLISVSELVRSRRDRAAAAAASEAEAQRRRVTEERLRIARELHDVVAHNMSLISIQAGVALHLLDSKPEQARTSLSTIHQASKEALVELRSILGVLRQVDEPDDEAAPRAPTSGLARLDDLVARSQAAGLDVRLDADADDLAGLPGAVDLAAYRIVQESLTNVARHSDDTAPVVRLRRTADDLVVEVLDEGRPRNARDARDARGTRDGRGARDARDTRETRDTPGGGGYGIAGMRERAAAVGGRLEAKPRPGQGFAVRAWLPLTDEARERVQDGTP
ncbi:MAG TPA: histidine kinase [Acidimicrobiales bacterium]